MTRNMRDLFDTPQAFARKTDIKTSHDAADSVKDIATRLELIVAEAIKSQGPHGAIWDELAALTNLDKASISPRFKPLRHKGLITAAIDESGQELTRKGKSNRGQTVWVTTNP